MTEHASLNAREREAFSALEQARAAIAAIPAGQPTSQLAEALTLAERDWRACQAAVAEAAEATQRTETKHPGDYWSARWRT